MDRALQSNEFVAKRLSKELGKSKIVIDRTEPPFTTERVRVHLNFLTVRLDYFMKL